MILIQAMSYPESDGDRVDENLQTPIKDRC